MLTPTALEKRLRFLAQTTPTFHGPLKGCFALTTMVNGTNTITLPDPQKWDDDYILRTYIHELCHIALPGELVAFGIFEESIIERVLEPYVMLHILKRPRIHEWWLKRLAAAQPRDSQ